MPRGLKRGRIRGLREISRPTLSDIGSQSLLLFLIWMRLFEVVAKKLEEAQVEEVPHKRARGVQIRP